jgi:hypothetical protein
MPIELLVPVFIFLLGFAVAMSASSLGLQRLEEKNRK